MAAIKPDLNDKPSGPGKAVNSSGLLRSVRDLISPLPWLQSRRVTPNPLDDGKDAGAIFIDHASRPVKKEDSFVTVSTQPLESQSSQEYEESWGLLLSRGEELEQVAAKAERRALDVACEPKLPPISRETSYGSILGKRSRTDSVASSSQKKRKEEVVAENDNPFVLSRSISVGSFFADSKTVIAQPPDALKDRIQCLAWGVQWEIARLVTADLITYADVAEHLHNLRGSNAQAAPKVVQLMLPILLGDTTGSSTHLHDDGRDDSKTPWGELDREEAALKEDPLAGLGVSSHEKHRNWYGGQVHFNARIREKEKGKANSKQSGRIFDVVLQKPELGTSNRFARRFGSQNMIRVRVPKTILGGNKCVSEKDMIDFFRAPFLLHGRVFRAFYAKEGNVFLVETNDLDITKHPPGSRVMSFAEFLDFHNPRTWNSQQAMSKWSARFALGLSNSVPGVLLSPQNIHHIADIVAFHEGGKPPPEKIMTDGCGFINVYGLRRLQGKFQWEKLPTAVQIRVGGAKGLLLLHPDGKYADGEDATHIWIRPSQVKINYDERSSPDLARLIIDVLQPARFKYPARLSAETIVNIAHNQHGTPKEKHSVLLQLMRNGLVEEIVGLTRWSETKPHTLQNATGHAMPLLWHEVSKAGGVMGMRIARGFFGSARARGFASRWDEEDEDKEEDLSPAHFLGEIPWTGCPPTAEEAAMDLLSAGFDPKRSKFLNDKLKYIVKKVANRYTQKFRINVPGSAEAFCVPDPCGVLQPGEVFLRSSHPIKNQQGVDVDVLQGDVLVTRHPTKTPTDVQRVKAVFKQELYEYTDVIIFPTKGDRSLASLLAGGDYDGDTVTIIWERGLVESFVNADIKFSLPPEGLDANFETDTNETVAEFQERTSLMEAETVIQTLQAVLLGALRDVFVVGLYSKFHENATYSKGYDHPETTRLAYMFCACLDGAKSGLRVKNQIFRADKKKWERRGPQWKETEESFSNQNPLLRGENLGAFIMDDLKSLGENLSNKLIKKWEKELQPPETPDEDLIRPWNEANSRATKLQNTLSSPQLHMELTKIANHVSRVRERYAKAWISHMSPSKARLIPIDNQSRPSNVASKINGEIILEFSRGPEDLLMLTDSQCEELKASYAYILDTQKNPIGGFAFRIAFRELLRIKATSVGGISVTSEFHRCLDIQSGIKALGRHAARS